MSKKGKYSDSLNLPRTEFPMRGNLAAREPQFLARWEESDLYGRIQDARAGAPSYILHDGPPYSNGNIHYGHILNKILKDLVVKYKTMAGFRSPYVPGWDTHGLPIELAVDRELGDRKRDMSRSEIRAACRAYALRFVDSQREEFKRLGVFGTWDRPYLTLDHEYEAAIARALAAFARGGYLYRGKKPVNWCPSDRTALAEAEIEYADHSSPSIYVRFPMAEGFDAGTLDDRLAQKSLALVIWTTTPWTLPANLAVVISPRFEYVAVPSPKHDGEYLLVAKELSRSFLAAIGVTDPDESSWIDIDASKLLTLEGARYRHPLIDVPRGENDFKIWFADYVTLEQGTGLVHTAPGHGADDYKTGVAHGLEVYAPIDDAGRFTEDVPAWQGQRTWDANPKIAQHLFDEGYLLNRPDETIAHSYPHCWRCKGPVLFRATDQWFISIDHEGLRERALAEIDATEWVPPWSKNRIHGMIENRPDWVLSRQRLWGVPIPAFYCDGCGEAHADADTIEHVATIFAREGADAWYDRPAAELMPPGTACKKCGGSAFTPEQAIVDVWFESGCSWLGVARERPELGDVDLYLEGSDQHRGWFHSSLLVGIGVAGKAPYETVLTHGFVLDEEGRPYSKSTIEKARREGKKIEYIDPNDVIKKYGVEIFRLWVASTEFRHDISYSQTILTGLSEWYRKFRNTSRYLLGNLCDFVPADHPLEEAELTDLDRYALARLDDLVARARVAYDAFEFHVVYRSLVDYVSDLSALYLDVIKDRLYSNAPGSPTRRAAQAVLFRIASSLARLAAPILCFTAEDVWENLPREDGAPESVHLALLPEGKLLAEDDPMATRFAVLLRYRDEAKKVLEAFRAEKHRSEDALLTITPLAADRAALASSLEILAEMCIVSAVTLRDADADTEPKVEVTKAPGERCERCWRWYPAMAPEPGDVCVRCAEALAAGS